MFENEIKQNQTSLFIKIFKENKEYIEYIPYIPNIDLLINYILFHLYSYCKLCKVAYLQDELFKEKYIEVKDYSHYILFRLFNKDGKIEDFIATITDIKHPIDIKNVFEKINYMMYIKDDQSMVIYITEPINDNGYIIFAIIESIKGNIKFALSIKKDNYEKIYNLILSMLKTIVLKEFKILLDNIENILTKIDKFIQKL